MLVVLIRLAAGGAGKQNNADSCLNRWNYTSRNPTKPKARTLELLALQNLWVLLHLICQRVGEIVNARSRVYLQSNILQNNIFGGMQFVQEI